VEAGTTIPVGSVCSWTPAPVSPVSPPPTAELHAPRHTPNEAMAAALLLIDGQPHWVWVVEEDVELLVNDPPAN